MAEIFDPSIPTATHLSAYDYVRLLTRSRIAWEYLRRNPDYRREWRISLAGHSKPVYMVDETILLRARRRFRRAGDWGLHIFR